MSTIITINNLWAGYEQEPILEDINFVSWSRGIVRKQSLDSGVGSFINEILPFVAWKRGKYYFHR